jgi:predicted alpha/beta-hydrolase family hydrolase
MEPENLTISLPDGQMTTGLLYPGRKKQITIILAHGAGAPQLHPFMRLFAFGLAERGYDVITFNFLYMEQRRKVPDPKAKLESCYLAVIETVWRHKKLKGNHLVIGGKSMGGRIASQVAAANEIDGLVCLVFLGYPLHPPGRPEQLRDSHLPQIKSPMLFIQGSRDAFSSED